MGPPHDRADCPEVRQVWAWSLDAEFELLLAAAAAGEAGGVILALDTEFPGLLLVDNGTVAEFERYRILRENVDTLRLIQLGVAIAGPDGVLRGAWSFNLRFDPAVDLHSQPSVNFLREAGIDFARHAAEGIDALTLGRKLAASHLVGWGWQGRSCCAPLWVTFSGDYDLGFLLKLLGNGRRLPASPVAFAEELDAYCPHRLELRDRLPRGSLEKLASTCGIRRFGAAHTAGSDALLTLGLYLHLSSFSRPCFDDWMALGWCSHKSWDLQIPWAGAGYGPTWEEQRQPPSWPPSACRAECHPPAPPAPQRRPAAAAEAAGAGAPQPKEIASPPATSTTATVEDEREASANKPWDSVSESSSPECSSPSRSSRCSSPRAWRPRAWRPPAAPAPSQGDKAAEERQPTQKAADDAPERGGLASLLRAGVYGDPDSLAPPPLLCLLHLLLLSAVFPSTLDTLLFLPLQVAIVFLLCFSGLVPRPPKNFLSAYLAGSCARLLTLVIWMAWGGFPTGLNHWVSLGWLPQ